MWDLRWIPGKWNYTQINSHLGRRFFCSDCFCFHFFFKMTFSSRSRKSLHLGDTREMWKNCETYDLEGNLLHYGAIVRICGGTYAKHRGVFIERVSECFCKVIIEHNSVCCEKRVYADSLVLVVIPSGEGFKKTKNNNEEGMEDGKPDCVVSSAEKLKSLPYVQKYQRDPCIDGLVHDISSLQASVVALNEKLEAVLIGLNGGNLK